MNSLLTALVPVSVASGGPMKFSHALKFLIAINAGVFVTIISCVTTPESDRKQLIAVSEGQMNAMGEDAWRDIKAEEKVSTNPKQTADVFDIGKRIAAASGKNYKWEFSLFDNKAVNAFCLPGGKVGVYTGILPVAENNAALAAVLGHEVAHAVARHGAERVTQQLIVAGVLITVDKAMQDSGKKQMIMGALGLGAQFGVILPYSRFHEQEADTIGLRFMAEAGYDPRQAPAFWTRMARLGGQPPEFLSTHPNPASRVANLEKHMGKALEIWEKSPKIPTVPL